MWEACDGTGFQGFCTRLLPGQYPSIASMGHHNRIASIRMINEAGPDARPGPRADYREERREERRAFRRRGGERLFDVPVANVRAVVGAAEQRCWVEREQVSTSGRPNVGGAVASGAIGANVGRDWAEFQDVQRCRTVSG